ncbi:Mycothiol acetyltransferase [compost metagenome]
MVIDASKQRQGLGRLSTIHVLQIMAQINGCEQLMVACHPDNKAAKALYKSFGFVEIGKNYDDDPLYSLKPQDAHVMGYPRIAIGRIPSSRDGSEKWRLESIQSEKDFNWADWEAGLVQ